MSHLYNSYMCSKIFAKVCWRGYNKASKYVEHFCDLRMDADLCLGDNVLMSQLRVLDSLAMQSGLNNISLINTEYMNSATIWGLWICFYHYKLTQAK